MVEVEILAGGSATLDGVGYTGPVHLFGETVAWGASTFDSGYVVVSSTAATRHLEFTVGQVELVPWFVLVLFVLGLLFSKGRFL